MPRFSSLLAILVLTAGTSRAGAQELTSENPCSRAPTENQVERMVRQLPQLTQTVIGPLEDFARVVRDDHPLRENRELQNAAVRILRFTRAASELHRVLSQSAFEGRPTARDAAAVFQVRRLLNRADGAFTLIRASWDDSLTLRRDYLAEYLAAANRYRAQTYRIALGYQCALQNTSATSMQIGPVRFIRSDGTEELVEIDGAGIAE